MKANPSKVLEELLPSKPKPRRLIKGEKMDKYLEIEEPESLPGDAAGKYMKQFIGILINHKFSLNSIFLCMKHLNKKYFSPPLDDDRIRAFVNHRFTELKLSVLKNRRATDEYSFYEDVFSDDLTSILHRIDLCKLPIYKTYRIPKIDKPTRKAHYWIYYLGMQKTLEKNLIKYIEKNDLEVGVYFMSLEKAAKIILSYINRYIVPYPRIVLVDDDFTLDSIQRKKIVDYGLFKKTLMEYVDRSAIQELPACKNCKINPCPSDPIFQYGLNRKGYRQKRNKELEWKDNFCSFACFKEDRKQKKIAINNYGRTKRKYYWIPTHPDYDPERVKQKLKESRKLT